MSHPYDEHMDSPEFIEHWRISQELSDECSSGPMKYIARTIVKRVYSGCCCDHDFDYKFGWIYGMTRSRSDRELRECISQKPGLRYDIIAVLVYTACKLFGAANFFGATLPEKVFETIKDKLNKAGD